MDVVPLIAAMPLIVIPLIAVTIYVSLFILTLSAVFICRSCCSFYNFSYSKYVLYVYCFPFYIAYRFFKKVIRMPRKKSRSPKSSVKLLKPANTLFTVFNYILSCCFHMSPISLTFTKCLSIKDAVLRYSEQKPISADELHEQLKEDKFLDLILSLLNGRNSSFFFKILPSGSLREGYGKPLPSTSILGSDYDLMLIPDGVEVVESSQTNTTSSGCIAPLFEAISDPNQNPETPSGYMWLKLLAPAPANWKNLCFDRITPHGGERQRYAFFLVN